MMLYNRCYWFFRLAFLQKFLLFRSRFSCNSLFSNWGFLVNFLNFRFFLLNLFFNWLSLGLLTDLSLFYLLFNLFLSFCLSLLWLRCCCLLRRSFFLNRSLFFRLSFFFRRNGGLFLLFRGCLHW